jgi:hypothetical protein
MSARTLLLSLTLTLPFAACHSPADQARPGAAQAAVESIARETQGLSRLTVHAMDAKGNCTVIASTDGTKLGRPSDKEDLQAMSSGKVITLEEAGAIDVTVPILKKDKTFTHAVGVTLKAEPNVDRKPLVQKAQDVAREIAKAIGG